MTNRFKRLRYKHKKKINKKNKTIKIHDLTQHFNTNQIIHQTKRNKKQKKAYQHNNALANNIDKGVVAKSRSNMRTEQSLYLK